MLRYYQIPKVVRESISLWYKKKQHSTCN